MTPEQFSTIKRKIEQAKTNRDRAEGAKTKIEESWKREFDITTLEEAESEVEEMENEITKDKSKLEKYYKELETVTDWGIEEDE